MRARTTAMFLEIITSKPKKRTSSFPILFIHGACHGAWCWENFLPFFASHGYEAHAVSLRGHGNSSGRRRIRYIRSAEYVEDLERAAGRLTAEPVLIGHSMGGYVVQKYLERRAAAAAVLMASIPVSGIFAMLRRFAVRHPWQSLKGHATWNAYALVETPDLARELLFRGVMPAETLGKHYSRLQNESYVLGLEAAFWNLPRPEKVSPVPMLVMGAENDALFTRQEVEATARAYGTEAEIFPDMGHDMMLDIGWQNVAGRIIEWLRQRGL